MAAGHTSTPKKTFGKRQSSKKKDLKRVQSNIELLNKYK
jgi:hypothetical protein